MSRRTLTLVSLLVFPVVAVGCKEAAPPPVTTAPPPVNVPPAAEKGTDAKPVTTGDPRIARAQAALAPLKKNLKSALVAAMADGPEAAVAACNAKAMPLTKEASKDGVELGRTSHRLRNPENAQADWMRVLYAKLQEAEAAVPYMIAELPDGRFGYLEPIVTQPLCLSCHGHDIEPAVQKVLDDKYPKDAARGFEAGQLRGAWWAVLPSGASSPTDATK